MMTLTNNEDTEGLKVGLLAVTADPRYIGRRDDPSGGDIIVDGPGLKHILQGSRECAMTDMLLHKRINMANPLLSEKPVESRKSLRQQLWIFLFQFFDTMYLSSGSMRHMWRECSETLARTFVVKVQTQSVLAVS
jgi:hypothetical protein